MGEKTSLTITGTKPHGLQEGEIIALTESIRVEGWNRLRNPRFWFKPYREQQSKHKIESATENAITLRKWEEPTEP